MIPTITREELREKIERGDDFHLFEVLGKMYFRKHHLPGANPYLTEFAGRHGLPVDAARGGAATMYPEYLARIGGTAR